MVVFQGIMRLLSTLLILYTLVIMLRILLTWFGGADLGQAEQLLSRVTDPYLNWFRRFEWLRFGGLDFSPVFALIVLSVATTVTIELAEVGSLSVGWILAVIVARLGGAIGFLLGFFLVLAAIRLAGTFLGANTADRFWITLDRMLQPLVHRVTTILAGDRVISYQAALLVFAGTDLLVIVAGRFLLALLVRLLQSLPF